MRDATTFRKHVLWWAIAAVAAMLLSAPVSKPASAQAGGTGGTIGKQDKSASGGEESVKAKPRPHKATQVAKTEEKSGKVAGACAYAVGTFTGAFGITEVIKPDGTSTHSADGTGKWTCSDGKVSISWNNNITDYFTPTADGSFPVVNSIGFHFTMKRL
jgi:hypothetical protein